MKCPYSDIQGEFADAVGMDKMTQCKECPHNTDPAMKLARWKV